MRTAGFVLCCACVCFAPAAADSTGTAVAGVSHEVLPGQTLWRIATVYGVEMNRLASANGIESPEALKAGRRLFIPGAARPLDVPPYPAPLPVRHDSATSRPFERDEMSAGLATRAQAVEATTPKDDATSQSNPGVTPEWSWPVPGGWVSSRFGVPRGRHRTHRGLDISGRKGQRIVAVKTGVVVYAGSGMQGYGKTVILDHGQGWQSLYAHNSKLLVRVGDRVEQGQMIARMGQTGNARGEHCHLEIRHENIAMDPSTFFDRVR